MTIGLHLVALFVIMPPMSRPSKFSTIQSIHRQRPLMLQLALAAGAFAQPVLANRNNFGNEFWQKQDGQNVKSSMEKVVAGLKKYQQHPYQRSERRGSVVWSDGSLRVIWFSGVSIKRASRGNKKNLSSIVLIPSMINGPEIFDICPDDRSFVSYLTEQGHDVFMIDWGILKDDKQLLTLDTALGIKLSKALSWIRQEVDGNLTGLGYCMGGIFLAASELLNPTIFNQLVFMATPWNFQAGAGGNFPEAITAWAKDGLQNFATADVIPHEWLLMIFAGVDPSQMARKFSTFADMKSGSIDEKVFVAVEDWVNNGCDLPPTIIRAAVQDWYIDNKTMSGTWQVKEQSIDARKIKKPSLVIVPTQDKIVPPASARALAKQIKNADILIPECGHISMMVAKRAKAEVWKPLINWVKTHS